MLIANIMSRELKTCRQTDMLDRAVKLMWDYDIGILPVLDDFGMLVGVVTDRDACMAAYMQRQPLHAVPASVAMTKHVVTCRPEDTDAHVAELMARHKVRRLPVVDDDDRPVGMISINDLALEMARGAPIDEGEVAGTLAAISEHRPPTPTNGATR